MFSWYKYLIVSLVFSHLGFWSGNLFLIAPFPDLCLLVPSYCMIMLGCWRLLSGMNNILGLIKLPEYIILYSIFKYKLNNSDTVMFLNRPNAIQRQQIQKFDIKIFPRNHLNNVMRKPAFCICKNKGADQHLCFCYSHRISTIPLLLNLIF